MHTCLYPSNHLQMSYDTWPWLICKVNYIHKYRDLGLEYIFFLGVWGGGHNSSQVQWRNDKDVPLQESPTWLMQNQPFRKYLSQASHWGRHQTDDLSNTRSWATRAFWGTGTSLVSIWCFVERRKWGCAPQVRNRTSCYAQAGPIHAACEWCRYGREFFQKMCKFTLERKHAVIFVISSIRIVLVLVGPSWVFQVKYPG